MRTCFAVLLLVSLASGSRTYDASKCTDGTLSVDDYSSAAGPHLLHSASQIRNLGRAESTGAQCDLMGSDGGSELNILGFSVTWKDGTVGMGWKPQFNISAKRPGWEAKFGFGNLHKAIEGYVGAWAGVECTATGANLSDLHEDMKNMDLDGSFDTVKTTIKGLGELKKKLQAEKFAQVVEEAFGNLTGILKDLSDSSKEKEGSDAKFQLDESQTYQLTITAILGVGFQIEVHVGMLTEEGYRFAGMGGGVSGLWKFGFNGKIGFNEKEKKMKIIFGMFSVEFEFTLPVKNWPFVKAQKEASDDRIEDDWVMLKEEP